MADAEQKMSSAPSKTRREDDEDKDGASKSKNQKKKKVRRHRIHKPVDSLGKVDEEETDEEELERRKLSSRERIKRSMEGVDLDDVPTLNYVIEEKPPVIQVEAPEVEPPADQVEPAVKEEEEEEFDDEDPCMTEEEKEAMYNAATLGDIDLLEDCLDKPNSDINMVWFQENLLVAALKTEQEEMAEFLIDNGVDYNFTTTLIRVKEEKTRDIEWEMCTCRQLAYNKGLSDITDLIDYLNGELFPFIKLKPRIPRYRRPKPPTPEPSTGGESENDGGSEASKDRSDDEGDAKAKKKKKKKKKDSREEDVEKINEGISEKEKGDRKAKKSEMTKENLAINDEDSGHHSSESVVDTEKDEEVRKSESAGSKQMRSRASSSKTITGSSRCSTRLTTTTRSPSPPAPRSETFLKRFCFLSCPSDEGYSSLASSHRSPRMSETKLRRPKVPITIPPRGTKSSFGMRQASLLRKAGVEQDDERPLVQKKITSSGSYAAESSLWFWRSKENSDSVTKSTNDMPNMTQSEVPKPQRAHYMQMTSSAFTKRKLEPNFCKAYSSLDFVSDRQTRSPQVSGNRKILHHRPSLNPRTYAKTGRENISLDLKSYNPRMLRPHSLPTSVNNQLFRTVIRVY